MLRLCGSILIILIALAPAASAGATDSGIIGTVRDASGGVVVGARVSLQTGEQAVVGSTKTDDRGRFEFATVRPGRYVLVVAAPGFAETRLAVAPGEGGADGVAVTLAIEGVETTVSVTGDAGRGAGRRHHGAGRDDHRRSRHRDERQGGRWTGGGRTDRRAPAADEPDDGRDLRPGPDGRQGERVRGRRALLHLHGARRRQHVPRSDRADQPPGRRSPARRRTARSTAATRSAAACSSCRRCRRSPAPEAAACTGFSRRGAGPPARTSAATSRSATRLARSASSATSRRGPSTTCARATGSTRTRPSRGFSGCRPTG